MYIHERKLWPKMVWNGEELLKLLAQLRHDQGRFLAKMGSLGYKEQLASVLQTMSQDVIKTSEIEGEILDPSSVRSSLARRLGIEYAALKKSDRNVEGIVEIQLDATKNYDQPLTKERLFYWHTSLFSTGYSGFTKINAGGWRKGPVQVISGHRDREVIHFEGPAAKRVDHEMTLFLDYFNNNNEEDPVLKSALMHLWFLTIHPFDDGNGRIGRAVADMLLARSENSSNRFYSLSSQIQAERKGYYEILEKTQKGDVNITAWIEWFLGCLGRAIENAHVTLGNVLKKSQYWDKLKDVSLNERQRWMIDRLLEGFDGKLTTSKWAKITHCSQDTAYRDILDLLHEGILMKNPESGRSTSYALKES